MAVLAHLTKTGKWRKTKIDGRTTRQPACRISQRVRRRIEEVFGWVKIQGGWDNTRPQPEGEVVDRVAELN